MTRIAILLRGINVGGHRKLPMAELKEILTNFPLTHVNTYIQSGNVVAICKEKIDLSTLCNEIQETIQKKKGFDVVVLARTYDQFEEIMNELEAFDKNDDQDYYITLFGDAITANETAAQKLQDLCTRGERIDLSPNGLYISCAPKEIHKSKLSNNRLEKVMDTTATTRNKKTMIKLYQLLTDLESYK